nr:MAG TPA: FeoB-associated Cys-rich membrane protein [Caudoviricetes sp.]
MVTTDQLITIVISLIAVLALIYLVFDAMRK